MSCRAAVDDGQRLGLFEIIRGAAIVWRAVTVLGNQEALRILGLPVIRAPPERLGGITG